MLVPTSSAIALGLASVGLLALAIEIVCLWLVKRQRFSPPTSWPGVSIVKPLCGVDDELELNLQSHLAIDYPGSWELILGVRNNSDAAYPLATQFAQAHPERVKLILQEGEPGHNPKVNQLITLTQHAAYELVAVTDSNVRVAPNYLREATSVLDRPGTGLAMNLFIGVGERAIGAIFDNLSLASFVAPNLAATSIALKATQVVGKSLMLSRELTSALKGWRVVKDVLAEDFKLAEVLRQMGLRSVLCPSFVFNVQQTQSFVHFWDRHARWSMIRFRVFFPFCLLEPFLNTTLFALIAVAVAPRSGITWALGVSAITLSMGMTQTSAIICRGYGFRSLHLLMFPVKELIFLAAWLRGATMGSVEWRGNRLKVLNRTRLAEPEALARVRSLHRKHRI